MKKNLLLLIGAFCFLFLEANATHLSPPFAPIIITGQVMDEKNEPLVGASIVLEGTTKGAITDENGNYKLELADSDKNGTLQITFVGFDKQTVAINGQTIINAVLNPTGALNEVVVVG